MTSSDAKSYLSKKEVPQLFECLMTALMYNRPGDHISFLQDCLTQIRDKGVEQVRWNMFLEQQRARSAKNKTPLPPITPDQMRQPTPPTQPKPPSRGGSRESLKKTSPLPPITVDDSQKPSDVTEKTSDVTVEQTSQSSDSADVKEEKAASKDIPLVILYGGPGTSIMDQAKRLSEALPGWCLITPKSIETVTEDVCAALKANRSSNGYILCCYPGTADHMHAFHNDMAARVDAVILMDATHTFMMENGATEDHIDMWREHTISVLRMIDNKGMLTVVDGECSADEVHNSIKCVLNDKLKLSLPVTSAAPTAPSCGAPVALLFAGPGVCQDADLEVLRESVPGLETVCVKDKPDEAIAAIKSCAGKAKAVLVQGYPTHMQHVEDLCSQVGDVVGAILLDCNEPVMREKLKTSGCSDQQVDDAIDYWKEETITVLRHYDAKGLLCVVDAEKPVEEVRSSLISSFQKLTQYVDQAAAAVEETMTATQATVEGDKGNPHA